jgi:hypothetical protein
MGATDSSTVAITIQVREDGSIGLIDAATGKLHALSAAGVGTTRSLRDIGPVGFGSINNYSGTAGAGIATFADESQRHLGNVQGGMRLVSGEAREMGLNIGYGLRRFLADSPAVMSALHAMSGLFIGLAVVSIGEQAIEGVYHLYEKWLDVTKEVEAYQQKAQEAAGQKLLDTASLETTVALLEQIKGQIDELEAKRKAAGADLPGGGLLQYFGGAAAFSGMGHVGAGISQRPEAFTPGDDKTLAGDEAKRDQAHQRKMQLEGQESETRLQHQKQFDESTLQGYAKGTALQRDSDEITSQHYDNMRAKATELAKVAHLDPSVLKGQYDSEEALAYDKNFQDRQAANTNQARADQQAITTAQNAATNSHLAGIALIRSHEQQAIGAAKGGIKEVAAIRETYDQQVLDKIAEEQYATQKIQEEAAQAGLTGIAKIQAQGNARVTDLWDDPANRGLSDDAKQQRAIAIWKQTDQEILGAQKQFEQEMAQITQRADAQMEVGYARIEAMGQQAKARLAEDFSKSYGQLPDQDPKRIAAAQQLQAGIATVDQNAQRERQQMTERDNQEIARMNSQTAQAYLPPWLAAQQRIRDQFDETAMKAKADLDAQLAYFKQVADRQGALTTEQAAAQDQVWNQYYNRVTDEAARAAAEMEKEQEQTRDKLAGALTSLFDNPGKYMEQRGKQLMTDILANWVLQLTEAKGPMGSAMAWVFGMNPEMSTSTNPKTALGSIFGSHTAAHGAAGAMGQGSTLATAGSSLTSASSTLNAAGATLSSSGTGLLSAAEALSFAADHIATIAAAGGGYGGGGGVGETLSSVGGFSGAEGGSAGGFKSSDINVAPTGTSGVMGVPPGAGAVGQGTAELTSLLSGGGAGSTASLMSSGAHAIGGTAGGGASLLTTLAGGGVFGTGVQNFMRSGTGTPSAGMSLPSMSVLGGSTGAGGDMSGVNPAPGEHVVADTTSEGNAVPADSGVQGGSSGIGAMGIAGAGMAALSGGMAMAQDWQSGNTGGAVLTGAMTGASIGSMFGPIGMGIGAVAGALIGFIGSLFGDQGAGKARLYNEQQVKPAISKEMVSYTAGQMGYDQGLQDMTMLQLKAQTDTKKMGSGAVGVYNRTIAPEIAAAIAEMQRQQDTGRAQDVTMQAAQYDSGGVITHFGDFSTGPNSGFIHARAGERVLDAMTSMVHAPTLDAMSRGADIGRGRATGMGNSPSGGGGELHLHIHALDVADFRSYLRSGAAQEIQAALNSNVNRYAGRSLG